MSTDIYDIALIVDGNGIYGAKNTIRSVLLNSGAVSISVIDIGMAAVHAKELLGLSPCIRIVSVPPQLSPWLENFSLRGYAHVSKAAYLKLLLHRILPEVDKLIYLDTDTLVFDNVRNIPCENFDDDFVGVTWTTTQVHAGKIRLGLGQRYFNSGVMVCNLKKWRENSIEDEFLNWYQINKLKMKFNDQEVLNGVFDGRNFEIGKRWNISQREVFFADANLKCRNIQEIGILHFNGAVKYWHDGYEAHVVSNPDLFAAVKKMLSEIGFHREMLQS